MKKKILLVFLSGVLMLGSLAGCGKGNSSGIGAENKSDNGTGNVVENGIEKWNEVEKETKKINESNNLSQDKMAFIFNECEIGNSEERMVITIDYKDIAASEIMWEQDRIRNDVIVVDTYVRDELDLQMNLGNFTEGLSLFFELQNEKIDESLAIDTDGNWFLYLGDTDMSYEIYYKILDDGENYVTLNTPMYFVNSVDEAKEKFGRIKEATHLYFVKGEDYTSVYDVNGEEISIKEYHFFNDLLANALKRQHSMNIYDARDISSVDYEFSSMEIVLLEPYGEDGINEYALSYSSSVPHEADELDTSFQFKGKKVDMYASYVSDNFKDYYIKLQDGLYLEIDTFMDEEFPVEMHQQLFIESFQ